MIQEEHISISMMSDIIEIKRLCDEYYDSQNINKQVNIFEEIGKIFNPK